MVKVTIEFGRIAIAHNFLKQAKKRLFEEEHQKNNKTQGENTFPPEF
ncbi:hypothetical protein [Bacillus cereus group sp. BfR-BA-01492]|nr:hypothetical protein [Bacillus cereus group sp. BfR-BA-01492]